MTLQLVEAQEGGQLLDLNQHEFHLTTGYELCVRVLGKGSGKGGGSNLKVHTQLHIANKQK